MITRWHTPRKRISCHGNGHKRMRSEGSSLAAQTEHSIAPQLLSHSSEIGFSSKSNSRTAAHIINVGPNLSVRQET